MNGRKLEIVKDELKHEISRMRPIQSFNTIFYQETQDNLGYTAFKPKLVPVNPGNASAMEAYLTGVVASGPRSPIKALDEAFTECPEQIYFLTDGEFDNPGGPNDTQVLACIRQKNAAHKIRINTVLFVQNLKEANSSEEVTKMLTIVAKENGGKFKLILVDDFQKTLGQPDKHD